MKPMAGVMAALWLGACGGGGGGSGGPAPDVIGMYQIDHHTESVAVPGGARATCLGEGPTVTTPPYLLLSIDDVFGLEWGLCDSTDPSTCSTEFENFSDRDGIWDIGAANSSAWSGSSCTLYHAEGTVTVIGEEPRRVRLELQQWNEYPTTESECTLDAASALEGQDACSEHIVIEATLL